MPNQTGVCGVWRWTSEPVWWGASEPVWRWTSEEEQQRTSVEMNQRISVQMDKRTCVEMDQRTSVEMDQRTNHSASQVGAASHLRLTWPEQQPLILARETPHYRNPFARTQELGIISSDRLPMSTTKHLYYLIPFTNCLKGRLNDSL